MPAQTRRFLLILGGIAAIVWGTVCFLAWRAFNAPLNTPLQTPTSAATNTPPPSPTPAPKPTATAPVGTPVAAAGTVQASPTPLPPTSTFTPTPARGVCGGPATMNLLIIGTRTGIGDNSDTIRVVRIDFTKPEVIVIPIPRDLVVELPEEFVQKTKLGSPVKASAVNAIGTLTRWRGSQAGGAILMAEVLQKNFGIRIDHYAAIHGLAFDNFINDIGGITVCLPAPVRDETQGADFPAGCQRLDGHDALLLARIRSDVGELGRIERQHAIVNAIIRQITSSPYVMARLPFLVDKYRRRVLTSLSPKDLTVLMCLFTRIDPQKQAIFLPVPRDLLQETRDQVYFYNALFEADVLKWDEAYAQWLRDAVEGKIRP